MSGKLQRKYKMTLPTFYSTRLVCTHFEFALFEMNKIICLESWLFYFCLRKLLLKLQNCFFSPEVICFCLPINTKAHSYGMSECFSFDFSDAKFILILYERYTYVYCDFFWKTKKSKINATSSALNVYWMLTTFKVLY